MFKNSKGKGKGGSGSGDDRCSECGGVGRHRKVRVSKKTSRPGAAHGQYEIRWVICPRQ